MRVSDSSTILGDIENWARKRSLEAQDVVELVIDSFYRRALTDPRLAHFFEGANLDALKGHQTRFMHSLFSGEEAGGYTADELHRAHENLIRNKGLQVIHFDFFIEDFLAALREQSLEPVLIDRIEVAVEPLRKIFHTATTRYTVTREERLFSALDDDADGILPEDDIRRALSAAGLGSNDSRLAELYRNLEANNGDPLYLDAFSQVLGSSGPLVERALRGNLAVPDFDDFAATLDEIFEVVQSNTEGQQAQYIPPLAEVDREQFGVAVVTIDGQVYTRGQHDVDFSIQSMCKPFNYCFALEELGAEEVHRHVGNEPSGRAFNDRDLMQRLLSTSAKTEAERVEIPFNPMINAGAIMTASLVKSGENFTTRLDHIQRQWGRMIGMSSNQTDGTQMPRFNKEMARQENYTGYTNFALAYLLMGTGRLPHLEEAIPADALPDDPKNYEFIFEPAVVNALKLYFATCSIELTAQEMATAAATLANGGVCPVTQERVLRQSTVRDCLSVTQTCGMYDGSGNFFFNIGLPAKSGVGGGVILVVPKLMGVCIFSPRLDVQGNSVRGVDFAKRMIGKYILHTYDDVMTDSARVDPRLPLAHWKAAQCAKALWAASKGDIRALERLREEQYDLEAGDYDQRTPMHLAAAEGHLEVIEFLLNHEVSPKSDRWGGFPHSDAMASGHLDIVRLFEERDGPPSKPQHTVDDAGGLVDSATDYGDDLAVIELLWAAAENNLPGLRRLVAQGVPVHAQDYDKRTALHLAAAEGMLEAVKYLVAHGHPLNVRDRWHATPLDEARREGRREVCNYLEQALTD
jgi:glutaminase